MSHGGGHAVSGPVDYVARHWVAELTGGQYKVADRVARLCANGGPCRAAQGTIATYLGLSREQVNRTLGQLKKVGLVAAQGRALVIVGWETHDEDIRWCENAQCRAEVAGRLRGARKRAQSNAAGRTGVRGQSAQGWTPERHLRAV
jgi:hypothetical protein